MERERRKGPPQACNSHDDLPPLAAAREPATAVKTRNTRSPLVVAKPAHTKVLGTDLDRLGPHSAAR